VTHVFSRITEVTYIQQIRSDQPVKTVELEAFSANDLVVDAVLRNFMVIGEATRHIPTHVTTAYPQIPWRLMQDMRNVVVHDYPNVSLQVVWETIQNDLPLLLEPLRHLLEEAEE